MNTLEVGEFEGTHQQTVVNLTLFNSLDTKF